MTEIIVLLTAFALLFIGTIWWLVRTYRRDRARERAAVRDVLSADVRAEIDAEIAAWDARRAQFDAALHTAEAALPPSGLGPENRST